MGRDRERRHLIEETPVAHPHGFRVPVAGQGHVVAAATAAEHLAAVPAMVPAADHGEPCLASHTPWRIVVGDPGRCPLHALLSALGHVGRWKEEVLFVREIDLL